MTTLYVQSPTLYLAGSGIVVGATSAVLTNLVDIYGNVLTMADFGDIGYITFEPDTSNAEGATFTGVTANANGTYTLTGLKTILAKSPYTQTSGAVRNHAGGTKVVVTDNVGFWDTFINKNNDSTVVGKVTFPNGANRPVLDADTDTATATAVVTYGQLQRTAIAGGVAATTTTLGYVKISAEPVSALSPIAVGDNDGRVPTQAENDALVGTSGTPSSLNKYVTNDDTSATATANKVVRANSSSKIDSDYVNVTDIQTYTTAGSGTWTKPTGAKWVEVTVIGGGGGGATASSGNKTGGGGGGAYGFKRFNASALGTTESYTVGAGGAGGTQAGTNDGTAGGASTFGTTTLLRAPGGSGGTATAGAGGVIGNGDIVYAGGAGNVNGAVGVSTDNVPSPRGGGGGGFNAGSPPTATSGGDGGGFTTNYVRAGGSGGAAGVNNGTSATAAVVGLLFGGVGGGGGGYNGIGTNTGGNGGNGGTPGGGGGGANGTGTTAGDGADGAVIVVTYF